jgi:hypothetical protein
VSYFSSGTCKEWLLFKKILQKGLFRKNVKIAEQSVLVAFRLLEGGALATFDDSIVDTITSHNAYKEAIEAVMASIFPRRAILSQKCYM